jgi:hypothetical protein
MASWSAVQSAFYSRSPGPLPQQFDSHVAAEESVSKYNGGHFMGNTIRVELARHGGGRTVDGSHSMVRSPPGSCSHTVLYLVLPRDTALILPPFAGCLAITEPFRLSWFFLQINLSKMLAPEPFPRLLPHQRTYLHGPQRLFLCIG